MLYTRKLSICKKLYRWVRFSITSILLLGFITPNVGYADSQPEPTKESVQIPAAPSSEVTTPQFSKDGQTVVIIILSEQPRQEVSRQVRSEFESQFEDLSAQMGASIPKPWEGESLTEAQERQVLHNAPILSSEQQDQIKALNTQIETLDNELRQEILNRAQPLLEASQAGLVKAVEDMGGQVLYRYSIFNGVAASIPSESKAILEARPDVVEVVNDQLMTGHLNVSVPSLYASTWWGVGYDGGIWDVGIIDTGVDDTHPALSSHNFYEHRCLATADSFVPGMPGYDPTVDDVNGHGTHVAGTVASTNTTYRGVGYGLDSVLNLKAGYDTNGLDGGTANMYWSDSMACVDWGLVAAADDADVLNLSFGGSTSSDDTSYAHFWDAVVDDMGVPSIVSAGNSGPSSMTLGDPCIAYNVMCVAGMDDKNTTSRADDVIWSSSSRGPTAGGRKKPDLTAPGTSIISTNNNWEVAVDWISYSGTSMSAPHVAGANMLLVDYFGLERPMVQKAILINTASDWGTTDWDSTYGWGYIDLDHAYFHGNDWVQTSISPWPDYDMFKGYAYNGETATLVWNRRAVYTGASYPSTYHSLSDIDLKLYREDTNALIDASMSSIDNVEQVQASGSYPVVIKVDSWSSTFEGTSTESYAMATEENFSAASGPAFSVGTASFNKCVGNQWPVNLAVNNTGDLAAHSVQASLSIPVGLSVVSGSNPQNLGMIADGTGTTSTWTLGADSAGNFSVPVNVGSSSYGESFSGSSSLSINVIDTPSPPGLVTPGMGSNTCDLTPSFTWSSIIGATNYHLQVDNNPDFSSAEIDITTGLTDYTPASPLSPGTYYWRVSAENSCGFGSWSAAHNFNILSTPSSPILTSPADGSVTTNMNLIFSWDPVSSASSYQIQVDNNSDFSSPEIDTATTSTNYTPISPLPIGPYYWRVAASNLCGMMRSSDRRFDIGNNNYIPIVFKE